MSINRPIRSSFTRLDARILQEENVFTVTVRLFDDRMQGEGAWGEEIAASIDTASLMIDAIAQKYSIRRIMSRSALLWKGSRTVPSIESDMNAAESKTLAKGTRVYWQGDGADGGTITETSWDAVTITWDNEHVAVSTMATCGR